MRAVLARWSRSARIRSRTPAVLTGICIIIDTDGQDMPYEGYPPLTNYRTLNGPALRARVRECGIVGLGGAAFPTAVKLNAGAGLRLLILNGAECEPYISCDDSLMRASCRGDYRRRPGLASCPGDPQLLYRHRRGQAGGLCQSRGRRQARRRCPHRGEYRSPPSTRKAGERQLIQVLTGEEVPAAGIPADIGILCQNVGTAAAVARAVLYGEPLISRVVTVTGHGVARPRNLEVRLGTPLNKVIDHCGGYTDEARHLIMGGAMMGFALATDAVPVIKSTNCLLVGSDCGCSAAPAGLRLYPLRRVRAGLSGAVIASAALLARASR